MPEKILIVDDEPDMLALLKTIITENTDYIVKVANNPLQVPDILEKETFNLAIVDLKMPEMNGIEILEIIKKKNEQIAAVILTAYGTIESVVEAMRKGAYDYITKPFKKDQILLTIDKVFKWQKVQKENIYLRRALEDKFQFQYLIGSSPVTQTVYHQVKQAAQTDIPILLRGEIGTGKELIAKAIHFHSLRRKGNFIALYSFLPEKLIESELFGYKDKTGFVEEAHRGTLFIDEIGTLNANIQAKLLRLLQHGEFEPVGDLKTHKIDIRLVASTSEDLLGKVNNGEFLKDLYYHLNVIEILIPPLRERKQDIPILTDYFLKKYNEIYQKDIKQISASAMQWLLDRDWPGNILELENVIERGVVLAKGDVLEIEDLFPADYISSISLSLGSAILEMPFEKASQKFQVEYIKRALARHKGDISKAAQQSGLTIQYLERIMEENNINAELFKTVI